MSRADRALLELLAVALAGGAVLAVPLAITLFPGELQGLVHGASGLAFACASALYDLGAGLPPLGAGVLTLAAVSVSLAGFRLWRMLRRTHAVVDRCRRSRAPRRLRRVAASLAIEETVLCYEDERPGAFCAGLLRPRIWISTGAVRALRHDELAAVLVHEAHHLRRRDPLRLLVARVIAAAFFALPLVRALAERLFVALELDADRSALAARGAPSLAGALYRLASTANESAVASWSASDFRVRQLCGATTQDLLPTPGVRSRGLTLASLALALALALGQGVRANLLPAAALGPRDVGDVGMEVHMCPLPIEGILV